MIGVINIDREKREIYKDSGGYFYNMKESVDVYVGLKSHIEAMQSILDTHPDAELDYDYEAWDESRYVVVRYKVYVDPKSLAYLDGTELDYVREGLNEGFKFQNPNVKDECGCGESFRV